jgi:VanZ family protein
MAYQGRSIRAAVLTAVAIVYWAAMFAGTHWPVGPHVQPNKYALFDDLQHFVAFGGLALLLCGAGWAHGLGGWRLAGLVLATIAVYGVIDELTQGLVPRRVPSVSDWLANMLGAGLGVATFVCCRAIWRFFAPSQPET